jgi:hypothetical protein
MSFLTIDRSIKIGDLLTIFAILISLAALLSTLDKDRAARRLEAANHVRDAAAQAIAKLDRWQALQASLYDRLRPAFIDLSQALAKRYDVFAVRDDFWRRVSDERAKVSQQVMDEQLGTAYADLISHFPAVRGRFLEVNARLADIEREETNSFLLDGQDSILSFEKQRDTYATAMLGNALRSVAATHEERLKKLSEEVIKPMRDYLFQVIDRTDEDIVRVSRGDAKAPQSPAKQQP